MAYDFTGTDLRDYFNVDSAAIAWCEIEDLKDCEKLPFQQMRSALLQAIQNGTLDAEITFKPVANTTDNHDRDTMAPDYRRASICREDLKQWALTRGHKPKFLFPEMRIADEAIVPSSPEEKEVPLRQSQMDKARCHAVAEMLWEENPICTIADMIKDKRVLKFGNGSQYTEKTLHDWLKEVDPRLPENKIGRPKKVIEKTE